MRQGLVRWRSVSARENEQPGDRRLSGEQHGDTAESATLDALLDLLDAHLQRLREQIGEPQRPSGDKQRRRLELELERGMDLVRRISARRG